MTKLNEQKNISRPPVVAVMGHIDHGKSTLLDYIRQTNVAGEEAGGITQHISAYEVIHKDETGRDRKITFLDTPGHEAFSKMRERGAKIADIAILVVSAEDGVKPQTIEAYKTIAASNTPCLVALNKIDKPGANIEKTKGELAENGIYLENCGGKIPYAEISAKTGVGVDNLLSLILILAELENFTGESEENASGFVLEANLEARRGIAASLVIKNGSLRKGMVVAAEDALAPVRIMENFKGEMIDEATFSSPVRLVGWNKMPNIGAEFASFGNKREAEAYAKKFSLGKSDFGNLKKSDFVEETKKIIPVVIKADVWGSVEAMEKEIEKIKSESAVFKIVSQGVGPVSESDIKSVAAGTEAVVLGFRVKADGSTRELAEQRGIAMAFFDVIYKMTEWLVAEMESRRPRVETVDTTGQAKILKTFSRTKERQILGGKVLVGKITLGGLVKITRRDFEIGRGKIVNLEKNKAKTSEVEEGSEFGLMLESKLEVAPGDVLEAFVITKK